MRKDDAGRASGASLQIRFNPRELIGTQRTEAARLALQHVDQRNEMHASVIETAIALVFRYLTEAPEVFRDGESCSPGTVCIAVLRKRANIYCAKLNSTGLDKRVNSPVWMISAGCSAKT